MSEETDKRTHAQRRRLDAQKAVRVKLRAAQFVRRMKEIAAKAETAEASVIPALRLQADIYTRLLAKCLPDLKSVEHSGEIRRRDVSNEPLTDEQWQEQYSRPLNS